MALRSMWQGHLFVIASIMLVSMLPTASANEPLTYRGILKLLDEDRLGFGMEGNGTGPYEQAMAYGLIASAAAIVDDLPTARSAADWLSDNAENSRGIGWGLGWEWDAFGDGSINPSDTVYGITTAVAIEGLVRAYTALGDERYLKRAVEAADYYMQFRTANDAGSWFWYSDQPQDAHNVHNVSAKMAAAFALVGAASGRDDFTLAASGALMELMAHKTTTEGGNATWVYTDRPGSRPNDVVHAAYIVYGAVIADRFTQSGIVDESELADYLRGFIHDDGIPLEFRPDESNPRTAGVRARVWGLGMLAATLTLLGERDSARAVLDHAEDYWLDTDYTFAFGGEHYSTRATAHLLLGAAYIEAVQESDY